MVSKAQKMLNRTDLVLPPQWADEGVGPSNYAKELVAGAIFTVPLQESKLSKDNQPAYRKNKFAGKIDNQGQVKVRDENNVTLAGLLLDNDEALGLFEWACNATTNGKQGPENSRTWLFSYNDAQETSQEIYNVFKGCKPTSVNINIPRDDAATIEVPMSCKFAHEEVKPTSTADWKKIGFAAAPTKLLSDELESEPIKFATVGSFWYDAEAYLDGGTAKVRGKYNIPFQTLTASVTWEQRMQDSNGSITDLFRDYGGRTAAGQVDMFKLGRQFNEDARTDNLKAAWLEIVEPTSAQADVHAKREIGSAGNTVTIFSKLPGTIGNSIKIRYYIDNNQNSEAAPLIVVRGRTIEIIAKTGGASIQAIQNALNNDKFAGRMVTAILKGTQSTLITAVDANAVTLADGADNGTKKIMFERFKWTPSNEDLIDESGATLERKSFEADGCTAVTT